MKKESPAEDKFYDGSTANITETDLLHEPDYAGWEQKKSLKHYWLPLTLGGMGIFLLAVIFAWIFIKPQDSGNLQRLERLEARLVDLEKKLFLLETLDAKLIALDTQNQKFQSAVDRFDQAEASMSLRMDLLTKEFEKLQTRAVPQPEPTAAPRQTPEPVISQPAQPVVQIKPSPVEHVVTAGDTLYSISRRYGLTVKDLLQYNNLTEGATIYPDQRLSVVPPR